jgi:alcohol dehydrogenase class IV
LATERWPLERVAALPADETVVWATASVAARVRERLPFAAWSPAEPLPANAKNLVVAGGGTMLDEAKRFVHDDALHVRLIAIPTIWGSGAEASPVVVLNRGGAKEIRLDDAYLPHARAVWEELASTIPAALARVACGDAWSHALEGFLSPLASDALRDELAQIIRAMIDAGVGNDGRWFELSARAAAAQARSSVGLVHGVAHTLEPVIGFGHARLCAAYLRPVFAFDRRVPKVEELLRAHGLDAEAIAAQSAALFDLDDYRATLPALEREWPKVLRDRNTRTNAVLVRAADLPFFLEFS